MRRLLAIGAAKGPITIAMGTASVVAASAWVVAMPSSVGLPATDAATSRWLLPLVVAPILEETAMRAGFHAWLLDRGFAAGRGWMPGPANQITAFAFAAGHAAVSPFALLPAYLVPGWLIGALFERGRRLRPCIALHACANAALALVCRQFA